MIHFTHNDLDALGCMLCVNTRYKDKITKVYHTNYGDFEEQAEKIVASENNFVIITDLSFAERPETLKKIIESKKYTVLIDHHSYPENFWNQFKKYYNFKCIIDTSKCASLICYENYCTNYNIEIPYLKNLCTFIDVYDCWREQSKLFDYAQNINLWYWTKDIDNLCAEIEQNEYKLPKTFKAESSKLLNEQNELIKQVYDNNLVHRCGKVTFVFNNDVFNPILIKEMRENQHLVVGYTYGIFKIRVKQDVFEDCTLELLRSKITGKTTGHPCAFSYKTNCKTPEQITAECKRIVQVYTETLDSEIPF